MIERLRDRPTADLVVLFLAGVVGLIILAAAVAVVVAVLTDHNEAASFIVSKLTTIASNLIGALVGYIGGRAVTQVEERKDDQDRR